MDSINECNYLKQDFITYLIGVKFISHCDYYTFWTTMDFTPSLRTDM